MKAIYFYKDTVVAVTPLRYGRQFVAAQWDGKNWRTLTKEGILPARSREDAEKNLKKWADQKGFHYAGCHDCKYLSVGVCSKGKKITRLICRTQVYYIRPKDCHYWAEIFRDTADLAGRPTVF